MTLRELNALPASDAMRALLDCCGSQEWASRVTAQRPFHSRDDLLDAADRHWLALGEPDWFEAFEAHPRIGERSESAISRREQAGALTAADPVKSALATGNEAYEKRFGFIFIVFASGKTPEQMLDLMRRRMHNDRRTEIRNAVAEQMKITRRRLEHLIQPGMPA